MLNIIVVIGLVAWTGTARLVRAEFLTLRETQYVQAAKSMGQSTRAIIFRHILPNALAPIFVTAVIGIPAAILTEAGLEFPRIRRATAAGDLGQHHCRRQNVPPRRVVADCFPRPGHLCRRPRVLPGG